MSTISPERVPLPPVMFAAAFTTGLLIQRIAPLRLPDSDWLRVPGIALMTISGVFAAAAVTELVRHRTTILPGRPAAAFVTSGPYRISRNPMYISVSCFYAGLALWLGIWGPLLFLPFAVWAVHSKVIRAEERYLAERFGPEYTSYMQRVRRWI